MSDPSPKPRRRRAARKLPGNHPYWVAGSGGLASWEPLDLSVALRKDELLEDLSAAEILFEAYVLNVK